MINVKMNIRNDGFCVAIEGHAEDEVKRNPLVCAAVSMLITTLAQVSKDEIEFSQKLFGEKNTVSGYFKLEPGDSIVNMDLGYMFPISISDYLKFFESGIRLLQENYNGLVNLEYIDQRR